MAEDANQVKDLYSSHWTQGLVPCTESYRKKPFFFRRMMLSSKLLYSQSFQQWASLMFWAIKQKSGHGWECLWWRGSVCLLLYLQTTMFSHLHSRDSNGLGMESLVEFGVSARMDNCLAKSCELPEPCILRVIKYFNTSILLSRW